MDIRPRRSVLYMPGANARALDKARALPADALILDLEDAVAPEAKAEARQRVVETVRSRPFGHREVVIRVNAIGTPWGIADLEAAISAGPDAILIPKVSRPGDIVSAANILQARQARPQTRLWAMMETPAAILNAGAIAAAATDPGTRLSCLVLGTNDLLKETRARPDGNRFAVVPWLATCVLAARACGLDVLDGVYNDFKDESGFRAECEQGRSLGLDGKTLIHPAQIGPCNDIFSPSKDEIEWSRSVIAAFERPENATKGVITVDGRMVERLHLAMARRTVAITDAIAKLAEAA
ncbi:MAG TPA: CoA ester lyase [Aestuariivirgaceae bacterium]|nr:CoA ester lyase [Aestuariivirgaceae bacterium]